MEYVFRPIPQWPHASTPAGDRRGRHVFKAAWGDTLDLLERELDFLDAIHVVIGAGFRDQDLRNDGMPRANAPVPGHPGVELSFDTQHGRLVYATDVCAWWQHNVRSLAMGLGDLRAVDLHIGSQRGQQYAGYRALPSGSTAPDAARGRRLIDELGGITAAIKATHPDHNPDADDKDFLDIQAAREANDA